MPLPDYCLCIGEAINPQLKITHWSDPYGITCTDEAKRSGELKGLDWPKRYSIPLYSEVK